MKANNPFGHFLLVVFQETPGGILLNGVQATDLSLEYMGDQVFIV